MAFDPALRSAKSGVSKVAREAKSIASRLRRRSRSAADGEIEGDVEKLAKVVTDLADATNRILAHLEKKKE